MDVTEKDLSQITDLETALAVIKVLLVENRRLAERIAQLEKTSATSSKPPSSDIVKPKAEQKQRGKRKAGGQKGHPGWKRELLPPARVDQVQELVLEQCPSCGAPLEQGRAAAALIQQQVELVVQPVVVTEYRRYGSWCRQCQTVHYPSLPTGVEAGQLFGPRLQALVAYMKGNLGASYTELQQFCGEVLELEVSRGLLCHTVQRTSAALHQPYEELEQALRGQPQLHIDESGWPDRGKNYWVWVFCNSLVAFFTVRASRGSQVLRDVLGETFEGAIMSDFFSAYVAYANPHQQFCLAHLIRDVKFLTTLPDAATRVFGKQVLAQFRCVFRLWHKRHAYPPERFQARAQRLQRHLERFLQAGSAPPGPAATLQARLLKHWDALFCFLAEPEQFAPTNNLAERTLRSMVRLRRQTQGTRSAWGREWTGRILTVLETCHTQHRSAWQFLLQAVRAHQGHCPYPSLLPPLSDDS